ncbi:hypothetical protein GCM10008915_36240 [Bifidobacterium pullorum subsp. gallinarum]
MKSKKKYVTSPYTYGPFNNPTSWGIWSTDLEAWTTFQPVPRKRDAEEVAKAWNELW